MILQETIDIVGEESSINMTLKASTWEMVYSFLWKCGIHEVQVLSKSRVSCGLHDIN
jgi:hypothetical protein